MTIKEIVYDPETDSRNVFRRNIPINIVTGLGESMRDRAEGRVFIRGGAKIITVESMAELARLYLDEKGE